MRHAWFLASAALLLTLGACSADEGPVDARRSDARGDGFATDGRAGDAADDLVTPGDGGMDAPAPMDTGADGARADVVMRADGGSDVTVGTDVSTGVDVSTTDGCVPGAVTCTTADQSQTCLPDGGMSTADCPTGQICVDVLGCVVCEPGSVRCGSDGLTLETCSTDGSRWTPGTRCNSAAGQVCDGYRCVDSCERAATQRSYLGCEYWPTTMGNSQLAGVFTFAVTVANPQSFPVTVTYSGGGLTAPRMVTVAPGTTDTQELPWVAALAQLGMTGGGASSVLARNGAYRLVATAPVAVYQFNPLRYVQGGVNSYTNDASLLLPTHVLTGNYTALMHNTWFSLGGELVVVGTNATATHVSVNLRGSVRAGSGVTAASAGSTVMYTLNRGDVLQLIGGGASGSQTCSADDLSGSTVTADQPVAVYVGHDCTFMPCNNGYCDHLEEQLFPNETWGRRYVVSGLRERNASEPSIIRIMSRTDGNALTFDGLARPASCPATLAARQFCEFETSADFAVSGSGALLIAQFMLGQTHVAGVGDPAMVLEVPTQQFRTSYIFNVPASYTQNFLTVVYPTGMLPRLDTAPIAAGTVVGGSGYSVSRFSVAPGSHRMTGAAPFGIKVTGTSDYTSYMYPGGLDLNQITTP